MVAPAAITRPGPKRAMSRPATRKANSGTISGPGAIARPVCSADQPHTCWSHRTIESSIAPNAIENTIATTTEPVNARMRNSEASISGLRARAQCSANSAERASRRPPA